MKKCRRTNSHEKSAATAVHVILKSATPTARSIWTASSRQQQGVTFFSRGNLIHLSSITCEKLNTEFFFQEATFSRQTIDKSTYNYKLLHFSKNNWHVHILGKMVRHCSCVEKSKLHSFTKFLNVRRWKYVSLKNSNSKVCMWIISEPLPISLRPLPLLLIQ